MSDAAKRQESPRIRFTITATTTLESLWYDEQWHRELVEDGLTDEQALKEMLRVGFEEDGLSILWEMFGPPPETAKYFAQAVTEVCVVQP